MTEPLPKPDRPAVGQRWRFTANVWEVEDPKNKGGRVVLRQVQGDMPKGQKRSVEWDRLHRAYEYLGDFTVPAGYSIHTIEMGPGKHCYKTPAGNVHGPPRGTSWTWKQARDAAAEHATANTKPRRRSA
jgi:hypothetical protein